jgi:hypothetical protein
VIRLILFLLLGLFSPSALATAGCHSQLLKADVNHDGKLSDSEYVQAVNAISGGAFKDTFLFSFSSLPPSLIYSFNYLMCICPNGGQPNCCDDGTIDISGETFNMCRIIDLALHSTDTTAASLEGLGRQDGLPTLLEVPSEFVISNVAGITASDLVDDFGPHAELTLGFDILAEEVVKFINDTFVEYVINSGSLDEIYDMECPAEIEPEANQLCQSVFTTMTILSNDPSQNVTLVREVYRQVLQEIINFGLLQDALVYVSTTGFPVLKVENETLPVRPTVLTVAPIASPVAPKQPTASVSSARETVIPNKFIISNSVGLTAANLTSGNYISLANSYKTLLRFVYENETLLELRGSVVVGIVDEPCETQPQYPATFFPSSTPSGSANPSSTPSDMPSVIPSLADIPTVMASDFPTGSTLPSLTPTDLPSGSSQPLDVIVTRCQIVKASHTVALLDSTWGMKLTFDTLTNQTNAAIEGGFLQQTLDELYPSSPLTIIRTVRDRGPTGPLLETLTVRTLFGVSTNTTYTLEDIQPNTTPGLQLAFGYYRLNELLVNAVNNFTNFSNSTTLSFDSSTIANVEKTNERLVDDVNNFTNSSNSTTLSFDSSTITSVEETLCVRQSEDKTCFAVSAEYNVTFYSDSVDAETMIFFLTNATNTRINEGFLDELALDVGSPFLVEEVQPFPTIEVTFAIAVSTYANITLEDDLLQQLGLAVAHLTAELTNEPSAALVDGSGSVDDIVSIDCPMNENNTVTTGNETLANSTERTFQPTMNNTEVTRNEISITGVDVNIKPTGNNTEVSRNATMDNILKRSPVDDDADSSVIRKLQTSQNVSQCYRFYGTFQVELLNSSVDALEIQQAHTDSFETALSSGDLQATVDSVPWLEPLTVLVGGAPSLPPAPINVEIQTAFVASSTFRLGPEELQAGGLTIDGLELAFANVTQGIVGNTSVSHLGNTTVSYLQNSSLITEIVETPCPDTSAVSDICYLVHGSYTLQITDLTTTDEEAAKQQFRVATKEAIDNGSLQKVLESIDSQSPFRILEGLQITTAPTTVPTIQPTAAPSLRPSVKQIPSRPPSLPPSMVPSSNPSTFFPSSTPTGSAMPSSTPSDTPSAIPSNLPSLSTVPSPTPSNLPSGLIVALATSNNISAGALAGIVLGLFFCLGLSGVGLFFGYKYRDEIKEKMPFPKKDKYNDSFGEDPDDNYDDNNAEEADSKFDDDMDDTELDGEVTEKDAEMGKPAEPASPAKAAPATGFFALPFLRRNKKEESPKSEEGDDVDDVLAKEESTSQNNSLLNSELNDVDKYEKYDEDNTTDSASEIDFSDMDDVASPTSGLAAQRGSKNGKNVDRMDSESFSESFSDSGTDEEPPQKPPAGFPEVRSNNGAKAKPVDDESSYSGSESYSSRSSRSSRSSYSSRSGSGTDSDDRSMSESDDNRSTSRSGDDRRPRKGTNSRK